MALSESSTKRDTPSSPQDDPGRPKPYGEQQMNSPTETAMPSAEQGRLWSNIADQRLKLHRVRESMRKQRIDLQARRCQADAADNEFMQIIRSHLVPTIPLATSLSTESIGEYFLELQQARNEYDVAQAQYGILEAEANHEESSLHALELGLYSSIGIEKSYDSLCDSSDAEEEAPLTLHGPDPQAGHLHYDLTWDCSLGPLPIMAMGQSGKTLIEKDGQKRCRYLYAGDLRTSCQIPPALPHNFINGPPSHPIRRRFRLPQTGLLLSSLCCFVTIQTVLAQHRVPAAVLHIAAGTSFATSATIPPLRATIEASSPWQIAVYATWGSAFLSLLAMELLRRPNWAQRRLLVGLFLFAGLNLMGTLGGSGSDMLDGVMSWGPLAMTASLWLVSVLVEMFGVAGAAVVAGGY